MIRPPSSGSLDIESNAVYQGQFGSFVIDERDRREVMIYRLGLGMAALCFAVGVALTLSGLVTVDQAEILTWLYAGMMVGLGISLWMIHIYMAVLHRALQVFWAMGAIASGAIAFSSPDPLWVTVYQQPLSIFGIGLGAVALTGIFFKEAFCFNRLETKALTVIVPLLLLGHLAGWLPLSAERGLLATWAVLFAIFALRKAMQAIPPDIGDKSVFAYLEQQKLGNVSSP